jgi:inner membrane protein
MPTIFTHPAITLIKPWFPRVPARAIAAGIVATMLPDADVVGFAFDIPYGSTFGHRGFTHSIVFALLVATVGTLLLRVKPHRPVTFAFLFLCAISHPILDAFTNGGRGIGFFSPFSNHRYFFPWRPIDVSPIGVRFFSDRGLAVIASELMWVWIPCVVVGLAGWLYSRKAS